MRPLVRYLWRKFLGDDVYSTTRRMLSETLGSYCAYCETPLGVDTTVEHKIPKSWISQTAAVFGNFLPCCSACNTMKGDLPNYAMADAVCTALKLQFPDTPNNLYWAGISSMVWPDTFSSEKNDQSFSGLGQPPQALLEAVKYGQLDPSWFTYSYGPKTAAELVAAGAFRYLSSDGNAPAWQNTQLTQCWVLPAAPLPDAATTMRVENTLTTLNLNYYNPVDPNRSDLRVVSRTSAWNLATQSLQLADAIFSSPTFTDEDFKAALEIWGMSTRQMALASGHFSVWLTVLRAMTTDQAPWSTKGTADERWEFLRRTLIVNELGSGGMFAFQNPASVFPGTDTTKFSIG